jgi:hypothetical protein
MVKHVNHALTGKFPDGLMKALIIYSAGEGIGDQGCDTFWGTASSPGLFLCEIGGRPQVDGSADHHLSIQRSQLPLRGEILLCSPPTDEKS